jgi:hypothetical protein
VTICKKIEGGGREKLILIFSISKLKISQFVFLSQFEIKSNQQENETLLFPKHLVYLYSKYVSLDFDFNLKILNFTRRNRMKWTDAPSIRSV